MHVSRAGRTARPSMPAVRLSLLPTIAVSSSILVAAWFAVAVFALYCKHSQLLIGFDGHYMLNLAQRQFEWRIPLLTASMDWFQGLGDMFFAKNFRLLPAFIAAFVENTIAAKVIIYGVILCEISVALVFFSGSRRSALLPFSPCDR